VPTYRIREAADLLGVSDDTVRRWAEAGRVSTGRDETGRRVVDGADLARLAQDLARPGEHGDDGERAARGSARNRMTGLVTKVTRDTVMAQVELQCGPYRVVSLLSREAADELALAPGVLAVAVVKSTNVALEVPHP
jgi:molybdopterin-binding protein